jgi:hypothetical protein
MSAHFGRIAIGNNSAAVVLPLAIDHPANTNRLEIEDGIGKGQAI